MNKIKKIIGVVTATTVIASTGFTFLNSFESHLTVNAATKKSNANKLLNKGLTPRHKYKTIGEWYYANAKTMNNNYKKDFDDYFYYSYFASTLMDGGNTTNIIKGNAKDPLYHRLWVIFMANRHNLIHKDNNVKNPKINHGISAKTYEQTEKLYQQGVKEFKKHPKSTSDSYVSKTKDGAWTYTDSGAASLNS